MTPREELLAAVNTIKTTGIPEILDDEMEGIISDWLQLEADQHWHPGEADVLSGHGIFNKWEQAWWTEQMLLMQPCIRMARRINGTETS